MLTGSTSIRPGSGATAKVNAISTRARPGRDGRTGEEGETHVQLAHRAGLDGDLGDRDRGGDLEGSRVDDLDGTAVELRRVHLRHLEHEGVRDLPLRVAHGGVVGRRGCTARPRSVSCVACRSMP